MKVVKRVVPSISRNGRIYIDGNLTLSSSSISSGGGGTDTDAVIDIVNSNINILAYDSNKFDGKTSDNYSLTGHTHSTSNITDLSSYNSFSNYYDKSTSDGRFINQNQKGVANGVASLDSGAKIPLNQLSDSIIGQVEYKGTWNAYINLPILPETPTEKGVYYVVSSSGTTFNLTFEVGDWLISNGVSWEKVDNTDAVTTVFGRLGNIVANESDYSNFYASTGHTHSNYLTELQGNNLYSLTGHTHSTSNITDLSSYNSFSNYYKKTELGNAALSTLQTSATDTTAGRLLAVGAFGLGGLPTALTDFDNLLGETTRFFRMTAGSGISNAPTATSQYYQGLHQGWTTGTNMQGVQYVTQVTAATSNLYLRHKNNTVWTTWQEVYHTGNLGTGTAGYIPFWTSGNTMGNDSGLFWDNVNKRLGIRNSTPSYALDVNGDLRLGNKTGGSQSNSLIMNRLSSTDSLNITLSDNSNILAGIGVRGNTSGLSFSIGGLIAANVAMFIEPNKDITLTNTGGYKKLWFTADGDTGGESARIGNIRKNYDAPYDFRIYAGYGGGTYSDLIFFRDKNTETLRILGADGSVAIGKTDVTSGYLLDVAGDIIVSKTSTAATLTLSGGGTGNAHSIINLNRSSNVRSNGVSFNNSGGTSNWFVGHVYNGGNLFNDFVISENGNNLTTATTRVRIIKDTGYVNIAERLGIGTNNPDAKIHIVDTVTTDGNHPKLRIQGGINVLIGNYLGAIEFHTADTSGFGAGVKAAIRAVSYNNLGPYFGLTFSTTVDATGNDIERLRIAANGFVGIGTNAPLTTLDITSANVNGMVLNQDTASSTRSSRLFFKADNSTYSIANMGNNLQFAYGATVGNATGTLAMIIDNSGNTGLGGLPSTKLDMFASTGVTLRLSSTRSASDWNNEAFGNIQFYSADTSIPGATTRAQISAFPRLNNTAGQGGELSFSTVGTSTGAVLTEAIRINDKGYVRIGKSGDPAYLFEVNGAAPYTTGLGAEVKIKLEGYTPTMYYRARRTDGTGFAFSFIDGQFQNDTTVASLIKVGMLGSNNQGGTPTLSYFFIGNEYNDTALRIYADKKVYIDGNLEVIGNTTLSTSLNGYLKASSGVTSSISKVPWIDLDNIPATFTPSTHYHDDRYGQLSAHNVWANRNDFGMDEDGIIMTLAGNGSLIFANNMVNPKFEGLYSGANDLPIYEYNYEDSILRMGGYAIGIYDVNTEVIQLKSNASEHKVVIDKGLSIGDLNDYVSNIVISTNYYGDNNVIGMYCTNNDQIIAELEVSGNTYRYANGDISVINGDIKLKSFNGILKATNGVISGATVGVDYLSPSLLSAKIIVGNSSNLATGVDLTLNANGGTFGISNTGVLTIPNSSTNSRGLLTNTDWNTFNNKPTTFIGLTDTPSNYTDGAYKHLRINSGATSIEFEPTQIPQALTLSGNTLTWNVANGYNARVTLNANVTTFNFSGAISGDTGVLTIIQDATGSRTLTLPTGHLKEGGVLVLSITANSKDVLGWYFDGVNYFWNIGKNYS